MQIKIHFNSTLKMQIQNKITEPNHLCDLWEHTIAKILKHDPKSQVGLMIKDWIIFKKTGKFQSFIDLSY